MPVTLQVEITISDDELDKLADAITNRKKVEAMAGEQGSIDPTNSEIDLPTDWRLVDEESAVEYTWGNGTDVFDPLRIYEGTSADGSFRLGIGECERTQVRGRDRKYFITMKMGPEGGKRPVAEFLATDDHDESREVVAIMKGRDGSARMFDPTDDLPAVYEEGFSIVTYRDRIDAPGSYEKLGVTCREDDFETMLNHTVAQIYLRGTE